MANPHLLGEVPKLLDVSLQRVQVKDQTRRLNVSLIHANRRRNVVADFEFVDGFVLRHGLPPIAAGPGPYVTKRFPAGNA